MTSKEIRQSFKDFFENKGHKIVPSAPMVVKGDPTLMFTNAGMNRFKDIILGNAPVKYPRVADSQKCLRVSGKHNDLEEVGHDTYHHTMFEMLGNWSFGDYFKREAIEYAWEYLTSVLKLDRNRLYVTVFEGSPEECLDRDWEAERYWEQLLPPERIIDGNRHDNFWEMGDTGPCGPCSEIHIDIRPDSERAAVDGLTLVNSGHPQVIEIWNLVFMQFNRRADGSLEPLPNKVIDTGMGFERLCMAVQNKTSNYDTDIFGTIIDEISNVTGIGYGDGRETDIAMRVVADHIRTVAFSITDGQLPSNAKAGYVIRRILRRAVRYGYTFLGQKEAFMYRLVHALIDSMGDAYPELESQETLIEKVIKDEEDIFLRTLENGIRLLEKTVGECRAEGRTVISGREAFVLYDTYGFPVDLTELILKENGMSIDKPGFDYEMERQKERARNAASVETGDWIAVVDGEPEFVGYDTTSADARILRYRKVKQKNVEYFQIVFDRSPFYAEMGGQVGDCGTATGRDGRAWLIFDTVRENGLPVHLARKLPDDTGDVFRLEVDGGKRLATECNHTATHLLHEALRAVLGRHVEQKGSFVSPDVLRFDFSHYGKMTEDEIRSVERLVTAKIRENIPLDEQRCVPVARAVEMGAMALFGEKYGEEVRVVRFGSSIELCGGTHISSTGRIGSFRIVSESSIAAGVRRIEAVSAVACEDYFYSNQDLIHSVRVLLNNHGDLEQAVRRLMDENTALKRQTEEFRKEQARRLKQSIVEHRRELGGVSLFELQGEAPVETVKDVAFQLRGEFPENMFFVAATSWEGKPALTMMLSDDIVKTGLNAGHIVRDAARLIRGGGGGQPHFATAGGKYTGGLEAAMEEMKGRLV
jgi:alanyl-tRNA synthetase